jgi:hypothetical protein
MFLARRPPRTTSGKYRPNGPSVHKILDGKMILPHQEDDFAVR